MVGSFRGTGGDPDGTSDPGGTRGVRGFSCPSRPFPNRTARADPEPVGVGIRGCPLEKSLRILGLREFGTDLARTWNELGGEGVPRDVTAWGHG